MDHKLIITGNGLTFEREINLSEAGQIMAFLANSQSEPQDAPQGLMGESQPVSSSLQKIISPREYVDDVNATSYPQWVLALGHYYTVNRSEGDDFSKDDIQDLLREIKEPPSTDINRDIGRALKRGWVSESTSAKGRYWITARGDEILNRKFSGSSMPKGKSNNGSKRSASTKRSRPAGPKKTSPIRDEVQQAQIVRDMEGLPPYSVLSDKKEKLLWILVAAKTLEIEYLTGAEVNHIVQKKLIDMPFSNVSMFASGLQKDSLAYKEKGRISALQNGIDYIKKLRFSVED